MVEHKDLDLDLDLDLDFGTNVSGNRLMYQCGQYQ